MSDKTPTSYFKSDVSNLDVQISGNELRLSSGYTVRFDLGDAVGTPPTNQEVENGGIRYAYDIVRETNDTLPLVTGDDNEQFADNYIRLRVNRGNQEIFHKVFTKNNFRDYVDHKFLNRAILEGMAFDKCTPEGLRFAVSVCYPGSDIYIPLSVTISPGGSYTIAKDEVLDTVTEADSTLQEE